MQVNYCSLIDSCTVRILQTRLIFKQISSECSSYITIKTSSNAARANASAWEEVQVNLVTVELAQEMVIG
jgi:hypothetical protein